MHIPDPADVPCRAVGLDLQSRPIEYKDFQSATTMAHFNVESAAVRMREHVQ